MYADIQQILHLNSNLSIEIKTESVRNKAYQELNKFLFPNIEEITTKGSEDCASVRDRKLNSLLTNTQLNLPEHAWLVHLQEVLEQLFP